MFVDLEEFESMNDTYGHAAGDIVLQTTARRLKENARGDDAVNRQHDHVSGKSTSVEDIGLQTPAATLEARVDLTA